MSSKKIFFLVGEEEYHSEQTMPSFIDEVCKELGCEPILDLGKEKDPMDLSALSEADLLVMFVRFREPTEEQLSILHDWFATGRPAVGIRTTSHAFTNARGWCPDYFGGHYMSHAPNSDGTVAMINPELSDHPIVKDLPKVMEMGYGGTYCAIPLADTATPLMYGKTADLPVEPIAWVNQYTPTSRIFFTSLGSAEQFENSDFIKLLKNGIVWCLDDSSISSELKSKGNLVSGLGPVREIPNNATSLLSAGSLSGWRHWDPGAEPKGLKIDKRAESTSGGQKFEAPRWHIEGEILIASPSKGDIVTEKLFGSHKLHIDFQIPSEPEWVSDSFRGTGGVFVGGCYEIELRTGTSGVLPEYRCGALAGIKAPDINFQCEADRWYELEVEFEITDNVAIISAWIDGEKIHNRVTLTEPTPRGFMEIPSEWKDKRPVRLQADMSPIHYSNIWIC